MSGKRFAEISGWSLARIVFLRQLRRWLKWRGIHEGADRVLDGTSKADRKGSFISPHLKFHLHVAHSASTLNEHAVSNSGTMVSDSKNGRFGFQNDRFGL